MMNKLKQDVHHPSILIFKNPWNFIPRIFFDDVLPTDI